MDIRTLCLGAVASLVVGCAATAPPPRYEIKLPEKHAKLANGMRVVLLPDRSSSLVEIDVHYEVGANEDPPGKAGLAHLVEHLMFDQHPAGPDKPSLGAVLRGHALYVNAFTDADYTHYVNVSRPDELASVIGLEASRLQTGCQTIDERGVYATLQRNLGPGLYAIDGPVDPERGADALTSLRAAIDGLRRGDGFLEDFVRARRDVLKQLVVNSSDSASLVAQMRYMAEFHLPLASMDSLRREVGALSPKAVVALVNSELRPDHEMIVAVGPRAKVQKMFEGAGVKNVEYQK